MTLKEQQLFKEKNYNEVIRYMDNAREALKKAGKSGAFYNDPKYVKMACGTAFNGMLIALDTYLYLKGVEKTKGRKSIEYYQKNISKTDKRLLNYLNNAYEVLHLSGYYDGTTGVKVIQSGFEYAYAIIERIKPAA